MPSRQVYNIQEENQAGIALGIESIWRPINGNIKRGTSWLAVLWFCMLPLELTLKQNNALGGSNLIFSSVYNITTPHSLYLSAHT